MVDTSMRALASELVLGLREQLPALLDQDNGGLWSVCLCGSYARGDFMDRNSDLDFHLVFAPGCGPVGNPYDSPGFLAVKGLVKKLLAGREFICHNPGQFDWVISAYESLPKSQAKVHIPDGSPDIPLLSIFLFDYIENLLVLWGPDPRSVMPEPLPFAVLAEGWFSSVEIARNRYFETGDEWRVPFTTFKSIQIAQVLFGQRTLDKNKLSELFRRHVPDFPLKDFGCKVIDAKLAQTFPENPCKFAPWREYAALEDQLAELALTEITRTKRGSE